MDKLRGMREWGEEEMTGRCNSEEREKRRRECRGRRGGRRGEDRKVQQGGEGKKEERV